MTLTVIFIDGKETLWEQFQTTLNTGSSNARTVTLHENFVLFGHDSQMKSDSTFDLIILRAKFYIYTCKLNKINVFILSLSLKKSSTAPV